MADIDFSQNKILDLFRSIRNTIRNYQLNMVYQGDFNQSNLKTLLEITENQMEATGEKNTVKKKVYNIIVETLQNITKHSYKDPNNKKTQNATFVIANNPNHYFVSTCNPILNENIEHLKMKINMINSLDKQGLKDCYTDIISKTKISEVGGAGLGLIDIARKSTQKLEFDFIPQNNIYSFFILKVTIPKI